MKINKILGKFASEASIMASVLMSAFVLVSCSDDNNNVAPKDGNPQMEVAAITAAQFGDSLTVNVTCTDTKVPLSTLKAVLKYGEESVQNVTIRTKTDGTYQVRLYVPFYQNVPDGDAQLHLTLQDIHFTTAEKTVNIPLTRPRYTSLKLVTSTGEEYTMTPDAANPYLFSTMVNSPSSKTVKAHVVAPKQGSNGREITFGQGTQGVTQDVTDDISFVNTARGTFKVTFNTLTYAYSPVYDPATASQEIVFSDAVNTFDGELIQGRNYEFVGMAAIHAGNWFYDPDFFTPNGDGTYKFNAVTGYYHITANTTRNGFQIWATKADKSTAKLLPDGSGAVWIIGNDGMAKPAYSFINGQNWWTDTNHALCMAQVRDKVYQITVTVGRQLRATDINFKFFGQQGWGTEFKGSASNYHLTSTSSVFCVGDGNGHHNGNIYLATGATLNNGDTYVFTVDLTQGCDKGVFSAVKQ